MPQLPIEILLLVFENIKYMDYGEALPLDLCENFDEHYGDAQNADMYTDEDGYGRSYEEEEQPKLLCSFRSCW